ncbi:MAG: hypothetical protein AB2747_05375 [Candidatus Thiodiazotropha taylori]
MTKFTLQVRSGEVEVYFANTLPADTEAGFHLVKGQGVNRNYGDGNVYVKDIVPEIASKVVVDIS